MPGLERLPVTVSDEELHAIDTVESFEAPGRFVVAISNHGRDAHVHLNLDDELASVARLDETNVYVARDATREVEVAVDADAERTSGALVVETGYGVQSRSVPVTVGSAEGRTVPIDDRLGEAPGGGPHEDDEPTEGDDTGLELSVPSGTLSVGLLAVLALVVAAATVALVSDPVVVAGVVVVLVGVLAAAVILVR